MGMIAIKEFKMPVNCETCKFSSLINGNCIITGEPLDLINMDEYRLYECPLVEQEPIVDKYQAEIDHLHKYIAKLETQITEESFINKPCVSENACEHDKNAVLDKIIAEIENDWQLQKYPSSPFDYGLRRVIEIIDKYKAESGDI